MCAGPIPAHLAVLFARVGTKPTVAAFAYLGVIAVALTEINLAVKRNQAG